MLERPEHERIDLQESPVSDLLDDDEDEFTDLDPYGEPEVEATELSGWVRIVIIITVLAMVASVVWWIAIV